MQASRGVYFAFFYSPNSRKRFFQQHYSIPHNWLVLRQCTKQPRRLGIVIGGHSPWRFFFLGLRAYLRKTKGAAQWISFHNDAHEAHSEGGGLVIGEYNGTLHAPRKLSRVPIAAPQSCAVDCLPTRLYHHHRHQRHQGRWNGRVRFRCPFSFFVFLFF